METAYLVKKEEYEEPEIFKKLKKEEPLTKPDVFPQPTNYNPINPYFNPMALPWMNHHLRVPLMLYNLNMHRYQNLVHYYRQRHPMTSHAKPFKIIKEEETKKEEKIKFENIPVSIKKEETIEIKKPIKIKKKTTRVSACKNYIGLVCAGIARTIIRAEAGSVMFEKMLELFNQRKVNYETMKDENAEKLTENLKNHVYKMMCGKKVKKSNRDRDFKIRNTDELDNLLMAKEKDNEAARLRKEVLRESIDFFFESNCYNEWISKGMMTEINRLFFLKNKEEVHKKFINPMFYKPHFAHGTSSE